MMFVDSIKVPHQRRARPIGSRRGLSACLPRAGLHVFGSSSGGQRTGRRRALRVFRHGAPRQATAREITKVVAASRSPAGAWTPPVVAPPMTTLGQERCGLAIERDPRAVAEDVPGLLLGHEPVFGDGPVGGCSRRLGCSWAPPSLAPDGRGSPEPNDALLTENGPNVSQPRPLTSSRAEACREGRL